MYSFWPIAFMNSNVGWGDISSLFIVEIRPLSLIDSTASQSDSFLEWVWPYVYSSAGIVVFVIVVITISMLSLRGCKGKMLTITIVH
jgi:hypothetical protein